MKGLAKSDGATALYLLAGGLFVFWFHYEVIRSGLPALSSDSYEYAQVGRNLLGGQGLNTDALSVLELSHFGLERLPAPYFVHDPGTAVLMAGAFSVLGVRTYAIGWASGICFAMTVPLAYLLGARLYSRRTGLLSALLVAFSPQLNFYSSTGLSEVPAAMLFTTVFLLVCSSRRVAVRFAAGLSMGALVVLRQNTLPFLPFIILFIVFDHDLSPTPAPPFWTVVWRDRRRWLSEGLAFLLGFMVLFGPNAIRTARHFGGPLGGLGSGLVWVSYTSGMPTPTAGGIWQTTGAKVDPVAFFREHPSELWGKVEFQLQDSFKRLALGGTPAAAVDAAVGGLLLLALLFPRAETTRQTMARLTLSACILTALLVGAVAFLRWRHLYCLLPVGLVYAAELLERVLLAGDPGVSILLRRLRGVALASALAVFGLWPAFGYAGKSAEYDRVAQELALFVAQHTPADAIVLAEIRPGLSGSALAWHARRQFISYTPDSYAIVAAAAQPRPVYLLSAVIDARGPRPLEGLRAPEGFRRLARFNDTASRTVALLRIGPTPDPPTAPKPSGLEP